MKQAMGVLLTVIILFMVGCNNQDALFEEQKNELKKLEDKIVKLEETVENQQEVIANNEKDFSYLYNFTEDELLAYERFLEDKDVKHFKDFAPERIVLIYFHSVVIDDVEAIYLLTHKAGEISELSTFREKYYKEGLHKRELETTLDFRYYDSIKVKEENKTENDVVVELSVNFGLFHPTVIYGLKREDGIWKMDILDL
jgi:hypothetical protein